MKTEQPLFYLSIIALILVALKLSVAPEIPWLLAVAPLGLLVVPAVLAIAAVCVVGVALAVFGIGILLWEGLASCFRTGGGR